MTGFIAILMFGPDELKPDILQNIAKHEGSLSVLIRVVFIVLLILDVPFLFYATKEQSLVMHNEIVNRSISRLTKKKIIHNKRMSLQQ